jgi:hypothetical protein
MTAATNYAAGWNASRFHPQTGMARCTTAMIALAGTRFDKARHRMPADTGDSNALSVFPSPCAIAVIAYPTPHPTSHPLASKDGSRKLLGKRLLAAGTKRALS